MQNVFGGKFKVFRKENTFSFPVTLLDTSLLNTCSFPGITDLEIEMADVTNKNLCTSIFKSLTCKLKEIARQRSILAKEHKWSDLDNNLKQGKLSFEIWNAI